MSTHFMNVGIGEFVGKYNKERDLEMDECDTYFASLTVDIVIVNSIVMWGILKLNTIFNMYNLPHLESGNYYREYRDANNIAKADV